jgi:starch synthase (maltosyl-transferring)
MTCPRILALFQKRIEGDNALLELAGMRFREAGLGAEFYAETTAELDWLLRFKPLPDSPAAVHLHRWINVFEEESRKLIIEFAERYKERIFGIVIHDQSEIVSRPGEYVACLHELESGLKKVGGPCLFIEYAVGLEPEVFIGLFKEIQELKYVSACIDSGHIGLWQARCTYLRFHPGKNIFSLKADNPDLPGVIEDVESAVSSAPGMVLHVIREIARLRKPLHFHLHDAHPASVSSPFGISDHLSFVDRVPIPFEYKGKRYLDPMFGPSGLRNIITEGMHSTGPDLLSFTLEIHPAEGRLPLGNASRLFSRWKDKGNAERMNFWLSVLQRNQKIILKTCGIKEVDMEKGEGMIIYNLFPLLAGKFTEWVSHLERASEMGFTWVFVNPIQMPGSSGSIYSIKDYFSLNPLLVDDKSKRSPVEQVKDMTKAAGKLGLRTMVDLVINHCSIDSALVKSHPEWFAREPNGSIAHPFADENGKKVIWKDLVKFDHRNTRDREGLFRFFLDVVKFLAELGFKGFRCDAAYQIPRSLWEGLIRESKKKYPDLLFFAETLGTTPDLTRRTASAGFDYIFNSSKWWDFESKWLMQQYNLTREISPSISFPESHDTVRLCEELGGNVEGLKQRYLFSAVFSAGVMMPVGFEFGFRKKLHVAKTRPSDWEETGIDLTSFITAVNRMKAGHVMFQEDAPTEILSDQNPRVLFMWKASTHTQEESLLILNKDIRNRQHFYEKDLKECLQAGAPLLDISPENQLDYIPKPFSYDLQPGQGIVLITSRDTVPED